MEKKSSLFENTLWLGAATVLSKVAVFLLMPLYTSALSPADFGVGEIVANTAVLLLPAASLYAPEVLFRFLAGGEEAGECFSCSILLLFAGLFIFFLFLPLFLLSPTLSPFRHLLFFYVAASVLHSFLAHLLRARGEYRLYAMQQLFCTLLTLGLQILFLAVLHLGVFFYIFSVVAADFITFLLLLPLTAPQRLLRFKAPSRTLLRRMLTYALPLIFTAALWWVTAFSDRYFILHYKGEAATGVYAAAGRIPLLLGTALGIFMEAWHYTALKVKGAARAALFDRVYGGLLGLAVLGAAGLILGAPLLVRLLFSPEYAAAISFLPILIISAIFSGISSFLGSIYTVSLRAACSLYTAAAGAALNLLLNFLLVPRGGTMAAALATLLSYLAVFLLRALHARRLIAFENRLTRLSLSAILLLLAALFVARESYAVAALFALPAPLFFSRELVLVARSVWEGIILQKKTRKNHTNIDKM